MTTVADLKGQTVAFAASGGLDSCTVTKWLTEHGVKVVCFTADIAQPDETDFGAIERRMRASGAADYVAVPLHDMIAESGVEVVQFQARYEGAYWNTTGIGRHVIVAGLIPELKKRGIKVLGHGATGRGNDQVRFQLCTNMLAPDVTVYAPWRDPAFLSRFRGRSEMIDYCESHKLPITASKTAPYSTDANLLGLTHEAGKLEHLDCPPWFVTPGMGVLPTAAPDEPGTVTICFEQGRPVAIDGKKTTAFQAIQAANAIGGKHAVGIATHLVENRFVGIKSRGVYEAPGMEVIGTAYAYLLQLVLDPPQPRTLRPPLRLRGEADLPGLRLRPRHAHGPPGARSDQRAGDRHDPPEALQGPRRVRRRRGRAAPDVLRGERQHGGDRRVRPRRQRGLPARAAGLGASAGGEQAGGCTLLG